jgi:hypothetical protein
MSSGQIRALTAGVLTALGTAASALTAAPHSTLARIMIGVAAIAMGAAVWVTIKKSFRMIL